MNGKIIGSFIVGIALIAGVAVYYLQVYAFYDEVPVEASMDGNSLIQMTSIMSGTPEPILLDDFQGIDSESSPLRFRGCFQTPHSLAMLSETFVTYDAAEPRVAPGWFDCFDAKEIGADLSSGVALPFLSEKDIADGFDRVIAVYPDGRAYVWHQPNEKYTD